MITAITGATGHVGANLVRTLLETKRNIRALIHHNQQALDGLDIELVPGDINDPYALHRAFTGADVVYHLAGKISLSMNNWEEMEAINVNGTRNVVEACIKCGVRRLIHFSSIHALVQGPLDIPVDELRPLVDSHGCPPYDRSKAAGEREVRRGIEEGLDAVILNPTSIIGPHDYQLSHMGQALLMMARGKLPALIEGGFDWVDVRDVAIAALVAEERAPLGARYLLSGHYASISELAMLTQEIIGTPVPRFTCPIWLARSGAPAFSALGQLTRNPQIFTSVTIRALTQSNHNISHARATRELNYYPRQLRTTLADTFRWFQETGLLDLPDIKI